MDKKQALRLLEVQPGATPEQIGKAFRRLSRQYHPDNFGGKGLSEDQMREMQGKMAELSIAYQTLKEEVREPEEKEKPLSYAEVLKSLYPSGPTNPPIAQPVFYDAPFAQPRGRRAAVDISRARETALMEKELKIANPKIKHYLEQLHRLRKEGVITESPTGYLGLARSISDMDFDERKKTLVLGMFSSARATPPASIVSSMREVCKIGKTMEEQHLLTSLSAVSAFKLQFEEDILDTFAYFSKLSEKTISGAFGFSSFLDKIGLTVRDYETLKSIIDATLEYADSLTKVSVLRIPPIQISLDPLKRVESYRDHLPLIFAPQEKQNRMETIANLLREAQDFYGKPNKNEGFEKIYKRLAESNANLYTVLLLARELKTIVPFKGAEPMESFGAIEKLAEYLDKNGMTPKEAFPLLRACERFNSRDPDGMADSAILFFERAKEKQIDLKEAVQKFTKYITYKNIDSDPSWTGEMKKAHTSLGMNASESVKRTKRNLGIIIEGYFASISPAA